MTSDLQPGTRVQTTEASWGDDIAPIGARGTVLHPIGGDWSYVAFDNHPGDGPSGGWSMGNYQMQVITNEEHTPMTTRQALALWARIASSLAAHAVGRHTWSCRGRYCTTREA